MIPQSVKQLIAAEVSAVSRYADRIIALHPYGHDRGELFRELDCPGKLVTQRGEPIPDLSTEQDRRSIFFLNGHFNHESDIQKYLTDLKPFLSRTSRLVVVSYNPYLYLAFLTKQRLQGKHDRSMVFLTRDNLHHLAKVSGYEVVRIRPVGYLPNFNGLTREVNSLCPVIPGVRWLAVANVIVLRPIIAESACPSLSIVVPARNEKGNIRPLLDRISLPDECRAEVIFVEGHSTDGTWEEIQRVIPRYSGRFSVRALQQRGKGKNDAVLAGFSEARNQLLTILDADMTVPPEMLGRFLEAYTQGLGDFIHGNRLMYPMEAEAMQPLNWLGNKGFAKLLSFVLATPMDDALCGTKLFPRHDWPRLERWIADFGDYDPFGDFNFLFFAAETGLGVVDIPIQYLARRYGETNILRFRHGWELLKMVYHGFRNVTMGKRLP